MDSSEINNHQLSVRLNDNIVSLDYSFMYVIYMDGESYGYTKNETNAKYMISSLSDTLVKEIQESNSKVYKEESDNLIKIFRQRNGMLYDGRVNLKHTIEYKRIPKFVKLDKIPKPPTLPSSSHLTINVNKSS